MKSQSSNPLYHIFYLILVILVLTLVFGRSWGNNIAAFFFIGMLLPIVLGTSYFFNNLLVPRFFLNRKYLQFGIYTFFTIIVSLYLEMVVLMFSFIYLGNFSFQNLGPNASDTILLGVVLYLLVFMGSFILLIRQIKEKQQTISQLLEDKVKAGKAFLEITSNRRTAKIPFGKILYIESLADYIKIHTTDGQIVSKEKISSLASRLPDLFLRIHRSFIINKDMVKSISYTEVMVGDVSLSIGRNYRKNVKALLR